jgi:hypothetical protein
MDRLKTGISVRSHGNETRASRIDPAEDFTVRMPLFLCPQRTPKLVAVRPSTQNLNYMLGITVINLLVIRTAGN